MTREEKIIEYYDRCEGDYRVVWHLDKSLAIHYGFWEKDTRNILEALENTNYIVAQRAEIQPTDTVLDAGCAVGGTDIYLAKNIGCRVTGITICKKQVEAARYNAKKHNVSHLLSFAERNYLDTGFDDDTFDVVLATESLCQSDKKEQFLRETKRVLKPGGRLLVADFFRTKRQCGTQGENLLNQWSDGWGFLSFCTISDFSNSLKRAGFQNLHVTDNTDNVAPSSKRLYNLYWAWFPVGVLTEFLGIRKDVHAKNRRTAFSQYKSLQLGLWSYHIISATT